MRTGVATVLVAAVAVAGSAMGGAVPVGAQEAPAPPPTEAAPPPTEAPIDPAAVQVAVDLYRNREKLESVNKDLLETQGRLTAAEAALAETMARIAVVQAKVDELRNALHGRAAQVYQQRGGDLGTYLAIEHVQDLLVGERYTNAAAGDGARRLSELAVAQAQLDQERAERDAARATIAAEQERLDGLRVELEAATARDAALLDKLGAVTVGGDAQVTAVQIAGWFRSTGARAHLSGTTTIEELAQIYLEEGAAEHVRGDVAFAQAVLETGSFSQTNGNNYAGIGNCDSCGGVGIAFPTPRDGVRAQIQHLRNYSDPTSSAARLANPPVPALYGADPMSAAASFDGFFAKGTAPVWNVMGNGNWATDPYYAGKVLSIFGAILGWAALHPTT
jgi:flagellum-specific peptidoglycan hydrolase FlgJ